MSKILVNEIGTWTGTEIALVSGRFLTGSVSQFKITGGTAGQALITDGSGGLTFGDAGSSFPTQTGQAGKFLTTDGTDASWGTVTHPDPTMGGDLTGTASNAQIAAGAVGATEIAAGAVGATEIAPTIDLSGMTVTLPSASVTSHVTAYDDAALRNDISTLALHSAIADNKAAFNLSNAFIDQFEDDTGIDAESTTNRNASEYVTTYGADSDVKLLLHLDGTNGTHNFVDSSGFARTMTYDGTPSHYTANKKFGTSGALFDGYGDAIYTSSTSADFTFGTGDFTIEGWFFWSPNSTHDHQRFFQSKRTGGQWASYGDDSNKNNVYAFGKGPFTQTPNTDTWNHYAWVRTSGSLAMYRNGTAMGNSPYALTDDFSTTTGFALGDFGATDGWRGQIDEVRVCKSAKYSGNFTPAAAAFDPSGMVSSGNFTSATQTALGSVSTMGIVVLYKNEAGTATLNTDLVAELSANGGTNYSNATLVAGGTFSTGISIAAVSGVSVTAGTAPKYKISFANQASGTKETQVHGVALLY